MDGDLPALTYQELLVWMPAHQNINMIGEKKLSNGMRLTPIDWRANRLVDGLAKRRAAQRALPTAASRLLNSGAAAVRHYSILLGRVTYAANNHTVYRTGEDGKQHAHVIRDAMQVPRVYKRKAPDQAQRRDENIVDMPAKRIKPWVPPPAPKVKSPSQLHRARMQLYDDACTKRRVDDIGAASSNSAATSASERLEEVARRVRSKFHSC